MGLLKITYAKMFDEKGTFIKNKFFPRFNKTFQFQDKAFNVDANKSSYFDVNGILINKRYYFYNISNSNPIMLDKKSEPIINPELYNVMLETKTAQKLNNLSSKIKLDFKTIIIIGAIIVGGYLLLTGKLF